MSAPPTPAQIVSAGWSFARRDPSVFAARLAAEVFAMAVRLATLAAVAAVLAVPAWRSVAAGSTLVDAVGHAARTLTSVSAVAAIAGLVLAGWAMSFLGYSVASGGVLGVLADAARGRRVTPWRSFVAAVGRRFPEAVAVRFLTSCVNVTLVTVGVGMLIAASWLAREAVQITGSTLVAPAAIWAFVAALYVVAAGLVRLTTEMVAAPIFLEDRRLGPAILDAAATIAARPVLAYRVFVQSAAVLVAPLFLYWVALFGQQLSIGTPGLSALGRLIVFLADIVLLAGFAAFAVMVQASFFAYHGWSSGLLVLTQSEDEPRKRRWRLRKKPIARPPTLDEMLPSEWPHVVDLDEILNADDRDAPDEAPESTEK